MRDLIVASVISFSAGAILGAMLMACIAVGARSEGK